ncbi:hypothetical protein [Pyrobaculum neutrophilum]|uniref:Uncharacterized protein n=1 Tax=Pyrobaculum neutrophilum (strain DSM 2338 / JCM 9278 / NBRC 100436 / V24Sta) TaxID=444157 RepID=B1YDS3_PYRNV|nr:hypothetical protein [Pyrobaculum neutrophilum]ACB39936.1 conserved hypothetical protein [Pyrobaculum neutrophilum V24Sta]
MLRVERQGPVARLVYSAGGREAVAVGPMSDLPTLLGLFVAQMAREGFTAEDICSALRKALEELGRPS